MKSLEISVKKMTAAKTRGHRIMLYAIYGILISD